MRIRKTHLRATLVLLTGGAVTAIALPAQAAPVGTVSVVTTNVVVYTAATGKANNVVVTRSGNTITVDDVHGLRAGAGCAAVPGDSTKIQCTPGVAPIWVRVDLQDGNDILVNRTDLGMTAWGRAGHDRITGGVRGESLQPGDGNDAVWGLGGNDNIVGGSGADALSGGDGDDRLTAGAGNDRLLGGDGADTLIGEAGNDLEDGGPGDDEFYQNVEYAAGTDADAFIGGAGLDALAYFQRLRGVAADADAVRGDDGAAGERDMIGTSVEGIFGGYGNDRLIGTPRDDLLFGGPGNDVVAASSGDDYLTGDAGVDYLNGAAGTDYCTQESAGETVLNCELSPSSPPAAARLRRQVTG